MYQQQWEMLLKGAPAVWSRKIRISIYFPPLGKFDLQMKLQEISLFSRSHESVQFDRRRMSSSWNSTQCRNSDDKCQILQIWWDPGKVLFYISTVHHHPAVKKAFLCLFFLRWKIKIYAENRKTCLDFAPHRNIKKPKADPSHPSDEEKILLLHVTQNLFGVSCKKLAPPTFAKKIIAKLSLQLPLAE